MLTTPTKETILLSIARFLEREVRPHIKDPKTNYHLLVSMALLVSSTSELAFEDEHLRAEVARLSKLLGDDAVPSNGSANALRADVARLEAKAIELVKSTPDDAPTPELFAHVKATLQAEISTQNPRSLRLRKHTARPARYFRRPRAGCRELRSSAPAEGRRDALSQLRRPYRARDAAQSHRWVYRAR